MSATAKSMLVYDTLAALRAAPTGDSDVVLMVGKAGLGDNLGGLYRYSATSTDAEDTAYLNVVQPAAVASGAPGRWQRVVTRAKAYPQGVLVMNGAVKTFFAAGTTNAAGDVTLFLTDTNTAAGNPLFTQVFFNDSRATTAATGPANAVTSYVKTLAADLRQTTHGFFKANAVTVTLGLVYAPFAAVGAGIPVQFRIEGM